MTEFTRITSRQWRGFWQISIFQGRWRRRLLGRGKQLAASYSDALVHQSRLPRERSAGAITVTSQTDVPLQTQLGRPRGNMSESGFPLALVFEIISHKFAHSDWADCIHLAELHFLREKNWLGVNRLLFCVLHVLLTSIRFCLFVTFEMKMIQHLSCSVSCVSHLWTFFSIVYKLRCLIQPPADVRAATVATALPSESWSTVTEETLLRLQAGPPTLVSAVCFEDLWAGFHQG